MENFEIDVHIIDDQQVPLDVTAYKYPDEPNGPWRYAVGISGVDVYHIVKNDDGKWERCAAWEPANIEEYDEDDEIEVIDVDDPLDDDFNPEDFQTETDDDDIARVGKGIEDYYSKK
jgi:hypothetical protein